MAEIVCIGELLVDILAAEVGQSLREPGPLLGPYPSGAPAIFADQAALLGAETALIATIGEDDFGEAGLARLERDGVDTRAIRKVPGATTGVAFAAYAPDGSRQFLFHMADAAPGRLSCDDVDPALFEKCRFLHVMGSSLFSPSMITVIRHAVTLARKAGAKLSFDPNVRPSLLGRPGVADAIREMAAEAEILLPSEEDLSFLIPGRSAEAAVEALLARSARLECVFLKRGAKGSFYAERGRAFAIPPFPVQEVDPTGAGDCTGATFLVGRLRGWPLEETVRLANAAGALAVTARGPMEGNRPEAALRAFLAQFEQMPKP
jgi:fructokinase